MYTERQTVSLTTDAGGDAVGYSRPVTGRVLEVQYSPGTMTSATLTVERERDGVDILTAVAVLAAVATFRPVVRSHETDGTESGDAAFALCADRVKVTIASGGDTKTCDVILVIG